MKNGKLRAKYMKDKDARAFLKKHPEFDNNALEEVPNVPESSNVYRSMRYERERGHGSRRPQRELVIQLALSEGYGPDWARTLLDAYYSVNPSDASIAEICKKYSSKPIAKLAPYRQIPKAKEAVLTEYYSRTGLAPTSALVDIGDIDNLTSIVLVLKEEKRRAFLFDGTWYNDKGHAYNETVQRALDDSEWDYINLG